MHCSALLKLLPLSIQPLMQCHSISHLYIPLKYIILLVFSVKKLQNIFFLKKIQEKVDITNRLVYIAGV